MSDWKKKKEFKYSERSHKPSNEGLHREMAFCKICSAKNNLKFENEH